jgi:hypothetical protein
LFPCRFSHVTDFSLLSLLLSMRASLFSHSCLQIQHRHHHSHHHYWSLRYVTSLYSPSTSDSNFPGNKFILLTSKKNNWKMAKIKDKPLQGEEDYEKVCWYQKHIDHHACPDDHILQRNYEWYWIGSILPVLQIQNTAWLAARLLGPSFQMLVFVHFSSTPINTQNTTKNWDKIFV